MLKKADVFQGKMKVKDQWSEVEYKVICQVANGVPSYEIKDASGNLQVAHRNQLFLSATPQGEVLPLMPTLACLPLLVELTPLECGNDLPKDLLEGCQTHHLNQSCSARMGGWCTATTSYGGPQISTKRTRVKDKGNAWR